jgi:hypothetical protein
MKYIKALILVLFMAATANAATHYVRQGASGSGSGSDWSNAYGSMPSTLIRGDTYYIADGSYGGYTFDDSGSSTITIKKATASDHGTSTGWYSTYGDGQATFGRIAFTTSNYVFDGNTRNSSNWLDSGSYGFVVAGGAGGNSAILMNVSGADNITIKHTYAYFNSIKTSGDISANRDQGLYSLSGSNNITMEYCLIKNTSYKAAALINSTSGPIVIRYNAFENIYRKELVSARGTDNFTFAFNYIKNVAGTGALVADNCDNWGIYGNVFWSPDSLYSFTDVIIGTWTGDHPDRNETLNNWKIYNNTFYQMRGATQIQIQKGSGNVVANNKFIGFTSNINGSVTSTTNDQNSSTSTVVSAGSGDFHLTGATAAGTSYSSPYNVDMDGVTRGSYGVWDRGAYEYVSGSGDTTDPVVTAFVIPATSETYVVPITTFTATDNSSVSGYCVNESATPPTSGSCGGSGWSSSAQTSYTFSSEGAKTLYAWAKDPSGNISDSLNDSVTITLPVDEDPPVFSTVVPSDEATNQSSSADISWSYDEPIGSVVVTVSGSVSGSIVSAVDCDDSTITCSGSSVTFTPATDYEYEEVISWSIQATDLSSNEELSANTGSFTVAEESDVTNPQYLYGQIESNGTTVTLYFSEDVTFLPTFTTTDFDLDCPDATRRIYLGSPTGSGDTWQLTTIGDTIDSGEECYIDFFGGTDSVVDTSLNQNPLLHFNDFTITNLSGELPEVEPPVFDYIYPGVEQVNIPADATIIFIIYDEQNDVDADTILVDVNGTDYQCSDSELTCTDYNELGDGYTVVFDPGGFAYGDFISFTIDADDTIGNSMDQQEYSFTVIGYAPVLKRITIQGATFYPGGLN